MISGRTARKQAKRTTRGAGERKAIQVPRIKASEASIVTIIKELRETRPRVLSSVKRWGFQCGMYSVMKCEAKAKGREIRGSGMAVAMAAPTRAWGSSSML